MIAAARRPARICLVSPGSLASNPRLIKEADALHEAGYEVSIIASGVVQFVRSLDETILARAPWAKRCHLVDEGGRVPAFARKLREHGAKALTRSRDSATPPLALAQWRHSRQVGPIADATREVVADLYIAHYLAALPGAAQAARRHGAKLGFDAEDLHHAEAEPTTPEARAELAARSCIEERYLPQCVHLTAASPLMARAYEKRYGVAVETILNVFPLSMAPAEPMPPKQPPAPPSLYWFSQTIGPGRGLEPLVDALGFFEEPVELHLRGFVRDEFRRSLEGHARGNVRLHFHPAAPPEEMARLAAPYDAGICFELTTPPHRDVCLTNKVFVYMLAGIPSILSQTAAHQDLLPSVGESALMVDLTNPRAMAAALKGLMLDRERLQRARAEAWRLGRERYHWDREKEKFLMLVDRALALPAGEVAAR